MHRGLWAISGLVACTCHFVELAACAPARVGLLLLQHGCATCRERLDLILSTCLALLDRRMPFAAPMLGVSQV